MTDLESRKDKVLAKLKPHLKNKYSLALVGVLLLSLIVRLYYFNTALTQAVWWDAADYLTAAKIMGGKLVSSTGYDWTATRPVFLAMFWGLLYRLGAEEAVLHLTEIFFAVIGTLFTYLVGKELYNKKIGLIAATIFSVFYLHLFYTIRLMSDVPAIAFWFAAAYYFWKGFIKEEKNKYKIYAMVLMSLSLFTRAASIFEIPVLILFLLIVKRLKPLKDKYFWYSILAAFLVFLPNLITIFVIHGGNPIFKFLGIGSGRFGSASGWPHWAVFFKWLVALPASMGIWFFIPFLLGLYIFFEMFLGLDLILKGKKEANKLLPHLFILIWFFIPFIYHTIYAGATLDERYFFYIYPPLFIITAHGFLLAASWAKKAIKPIEGYKFVKYIPVVLVLFVLVMGINFQLTRGDSLIKSKQNSYYPVKLAGLWLKQNSEPDDIIISGSRYQNIYYSERNTYNFALEMFADRELILEEIEKQNIPRDVHGYLSEEAFDELIKELKPRYMIVSVFETHPPWTYTYADRHPNVKAVEGYSQDGQGQPVLIIYEFNSWESAVEIPEPVFTLTGDEDGN